MSARDQRSEVSGQTAEAIARQACSLIVIDLSGDEQAAAELRELARLYTGGNLSAMARLLMLERLVPIQFNAEIADFLKRRRKAA